MAAGTKIVFDSGAQVAGTDETAATLTVQSTPTGRSRTGAGGAKPIMARSDRPMRIASGTLTFDTSYPTGGEDITPIWKQFRATTRDKDHVATAWDLRGIMVEQPNNGKAVQIDYTNKKAKVVTAFAGTEAANASDQSTVSVRFIAWGT